MKKLGHIALSLMFASTLLFSIEPANAKGKDGCCGKMKQNHCCRAQARQDRRIAHKTSKVSRMSTRMGKNGYTKREVNRINNSQARLNKAKTR